MAKAVLTLAERAYLDRHRVARLATSDVAHHPHVVPIVYACLHDALFFVVDDKPKRTHTQLRRLHNIEQNANVALLVDDYDEDWTRLSYLYLEGSAHRVRDEEQYAHALAALRARYPQYHVMKFDIDSHPMVQIDIERSRIWKSAAE